MKTLNENKFDKLFKERFSDYSENPPDAVFNKIKNTASNFNNPASFWKKGGFFVSIAVVIIAISVVLIVNSFNTLNEKQIAKPISQNNLIAENNILKNNIIAIHAETSIVNNNNVKTNKTKIINQQEIVVKSAVIDNSDNFNSANQITVKSILPDNNQLPETQSEFEIQINVKPATCHKHNGKVSLSSDIADVKFYCMDFNPNKQITFIDNLNAGTYNFKAELNTVSKNFIVNVTDSGIVKARFTHYEITQAIGVPVYFSNKSTVDGKNFDGISDVSFKWYFGDALNSFEPNPVHNYNSIGPFTISLVAYNSIGCKDSTISLPLSIAGSAIDLPNIFSPNGDGINDVFMPAVTAVRNFECVIFNTNGETVYKWNNPEQGWDGKINNGLQMANPGIYFYIINAVGIDGKVLKEKGFVYLLK